MYIDKKTLMRQKRNWLLLTWPLGLAAYLLAVNSTWIAEHVFALGVFRVFSSVGVFLTGWIPFSLAEMLLIAIVPAVMAVVAVFIIKAVKRTEGRHIFILSGIRNLFIFLGVIYLIFMVNCGTNYYRYSFTEYSGLTVMNSTVNELYDMCMDLAARTNEAREVLVKACPQEGEVFDSPLSEYERAGLAADALERLSEQYEVLSRNYPRPKSVLFSDFMSELNITGVYFPFTMEANVNVSIPDYSRASVLCHELSHVAGFMREDEANYIAYRACCVSDSPEFNYSGLMSALINAGNSLYAQDAELYYKVSAAYSDGVRSDLIANSEYWSQFKDTVLSEAGEKINDTYLKANNQKDGTKSYGRMVDLLLAEYRSRANGGE